MSECETLGSVVILDDFNAHLSVDGRNIQGVLLQEVLDRNVCMYCLCVWWLGGVAPSQCWV